ncbi:hypothetical protein AAVH_25078 [Aphelenchoides avenae]|nr:hypothetical protein AAVH_25078 [Aphelenchus avenae]
MAWRSLQQANWSYTKKLISLYICGVIPLNSGSIGYRRRQSVVRSIVKSFDKLRVPECFEFAMSALIFSHVDYLVIDNYYMT